MVGPKVVAEHPCILKEKGRQKLTHLIKQNRHQTMAQLTTQYNVDPSSCVLKHTVQWTLLENVADVPLGALTSKFEQLLYPFTQAGDDGIMLLRAFSWMDLVPLVLVEETMDVVDSLSIIVDQLHTRMAYVFHTGKGIFQKDNVPCQDARTRIE
ncbi:transposable element Tcb2 transposase [Trichonephila clavipes]|nr:transposable element Tcb2 transposase [Trichonephila clavipes]